MAIPKESARVDDRERALHAVRSWTWVAGLGGIGLTGAMALLAAGSFAGRQATAASPPAATLTPASSDNNVAAQPQQAPQGSLGASSQPPTAVSGGS